MLTTDDAVCVSFIAYNNRFTLFFTFLTGMWHLAFRLLKLQFIATLLSDPIISGFSTGAAFVTGTSQVQHTNPAL
jgi:MFS superfamily sulfate permease-like transporter